MHADAVLSRGTLGTIEDVMKGAIIGEIRGAAMGITGGEAILLGLGVVEGGIFCDATITATIVGSLIMPKVLLLWAALEG